MKRLAFFMFLAAAVSACRPEPPEEIGPRYSTSEGVDGTWLIDEVVVVDESSPIKLERDITDFYSATAPNFGISLDVDAKTYTVNEGTNVRHFFGDGGSFGFDDDEFPTRIYFYEQGDTVEMSFNRATRSTDPFLDLSFERDACEKTYVSYQYLFTRQ